jgi:hypothetical protein
MIFYLLAYYFLGASRQVLVVVTDASVCLVVLVVLVDEIALLYIHVRTNWKCSSSTLYRVLNARSFYLVCMVGRLQSFITTSV